MSERIQKNDQEEESIWQKEIRENRWSRLRPASLCSPGRTLREKGHVRVQTGDSVRKVNVPHIPAGGNS